MFKHRECYSPPREEGWLHEAQTGWGLTSPLSAWRFLSILFVTALSVITPALAQDASLEDRVKATFIFNFIQFAEWPRTPVSGGPSFTICIVGDAFREVMEETVRGETVNGQPLTVREVMHARDAAGCRVIYFRNSANRIAAQEILNAAK